MSGKPTPGSAPGTKVIVLEGGPPDWDGRVEGISKTSTGQVERWDQVADAILVYLQTDRTKEVPITHERRNGPVVELKAAEVYAFAGYKEELQ